MSFRHQLRRGLLALPMLCLLTAGFVSVQLEPERRVERNYPEAEVCLRTPAGADIAG